MQTRQNLSLLPCSSSCCSTCTQSCHTVLTEAMLSVSKYSSSIYHLFSWLSVRACVCLVHMSAFSLTHQPHQAEISQREVSLLQGRVSMAEELHRLTSCGEILEYSRDTAEKDCRRLLRQSSQVSQVRPSHDVFSIGSAGRLTECLPVHMLHTLCWTGRAESRRTSRNTVIMQPAPRNYTSA